MGVALLLSSGAARAAIAYVNDNTVAATSSTQGSVTGTLTGVTAGNLLVAIVACDSNATITKPTGWTDPGVRADSGANVGVAIYYYPNYPSSGTVNATFSFSVANGSGIVQIVELAGTVTSSPLDITATASGRGTSATITAASATTASDEVAIVGWANNTGNRTFGTPTAPWALINNDVQSTTTDEQGTYQTGIAFGTTLTETLSVQRATTYWAIAMVTFKPAQLYWRGGLTGCASGSLFTSTSCWSKTSGGSSAGVAPTTGDLAVFDGNGTGNCALSSSAATSLTSLTMTSGYTGTITQGSRGVTLSGDLSISGGTFTGASGQTIAVSGTLTAGGGTFNGNGATVTVGGFSVTGGTYTQGTGNFTDSGAATFSGGTSTFSSGTSAFQSTLTTSGTTTRLTFGTGAPTVTGLATFGGTSTVTFGTGQVSLQGGLDVEGAGVTFGSSASTATVTGTVTIGSGTVNLANGTAATDFTCTDVFTQSGGTFNVNGATATLGTGITGSTNDAFLQSGGTFTNTTAGGSVAFGTTGGGGGVMTQSGSGAVYSSVSTASETFNGPVDVYGSMTLGNATLAGSTNARKLVTIESGGALTLSSTGFAFFSTSTMTLAGTLNANGTVTFAGTVTLSGTMNANASTTTFNGNVTLSGTYNGNTSSTTFSNPVTLSGSVNSNSASQMKFSSTLALTGSFSANTCTNVIFTGAVTISGSGAFHGGTGSGTFSAAPTFTAGSFTVGNANTTGRWTMTAGASFASGMTLTFPSSGGELATESGQTISIAGTITAATTGATKPKIDCPACTTNQGFTMTFTSSAVLNVDGLQFDHVATTGVTIASGAVYTSFKNVKFTNNAAGGTSSGTHLAITSTNTVLRLPGLYFDATAQYNLTLSGTSGSTGVKAILENQSTTANGARAGESYDLDADTGDDNVADTTTSPRYGSVVEWAGASPTDTAGTAVGFPTAAFDWNTFSYYGIYVAYKNVSGAGSSDTLWLRNSDGSAAYSYSVANSSGDLIGTPRWDTVNETTAGLDANGDGDQTDTNVHVVYLATTTGHVIKLIDSGSALARPASGVWSTDFTSSTVASITSPLIADGTNLYFGGTDNTAATKVFGVQISSGANEKTLQKNIGSVSAINAAPSWKVYSGNTYLFLGSTATASQAYVYRVNATSGSVQASFSGPTATVNDSVRLIADRAYAVTDNGKLYALDASNFNTGGFTNLSTFNSGAPYSGSGGNAMKAGPYVDPYTNNIYLGDNAGNLYVVTSTGGNLTGYPNTTLLSGTQLSSSPVYLQASGIIAIGASNGYVYFVNRHNTSNVAAIYKRFLVTSSGTVSSVGYNYSTSQYMVSSSDGKLMFINGADVADPDATE